MSEIIDTLCQEHRNIDKLLGALESELNVFDCGHRPGYEVIVAIIEYFKNYPDTCHHPKEDLIVETLKLRDPAGAAAIGDLQAEHREGAERLRQVAQAVEQVLNDQILLRQTVDEIIRDFIDRERQHMAREERVVFPAAVRALSPEDWADVAVKIADRYGPPSAPDFEEQFSTLRRNILELEQLAAQTRSN